MHDINWRNCYIIRLKRKILYSTAVLSFYSIMYSVIEEDYISSSLLVTVRCVCCYKSSLFFFGFSEARAIK